MENFAGKKIVLLNGSPRKSGMTASLLKHFQTIIETTDDNHINVDYHDIVDFKINHCTGCDTCLRKPHECSQSNTDDMLKLETILKNADGIVIGAPAYFGSVPGILKDMIDRSRPMKMAKYQLKDKLFSTISTAGLQAGGHNWVVDTLNHFALMHGMIVVGSVGHPVLVSNFAGETLQMNNVKEFRKISEPGEIGLKTTEELAKRFIDLLK